MTGAALIMLYIFDHVLYIANLKITLIYIYPSTIPPDTPCHPNLL